MITVWKYEIELDDYTELWIPDGGQVLSFQVQNGTPRIWVLVDNGHKNTFRKFRMAGTGHPIDDPNPRYIGTVQVEDGGIILHLFEIDTEVENC